MGTSARGLSLVWLGRRLPVCDTAPTTMDTLTSGIPSAPRREPMPLDPVRLDPETSPHDHACAATALYGPDLALLHYLLQDLRALARRHADGSVGLHSHQTLTWEVHGLTRRTVICDPVRLTAPTPMWHALRTFDPARRFDESTQPNRALR